MIKDKDYTVSSEHGVVHINSKHNCLGRYSKNGYEVYRDMGAPVEVIGSTNTLAIRVHATKPLDWDNFKKFMMEHHNINLDDMEYPHA